MDEDRYWIDWCPIVKPFANSFAIVDEEVGGIVAYVCDEKIAINLIGLLNKQECE